jgi:hypothetical protein
MEEKEVKIVTGQLISLISKSVFFGIKSTNFILNMVDNLNDEQSHPDIFF